MCVRICTEFNHVHRSRWYSDIFDRIHLFRLFTQVHLLIDGSVEGQYVIFEVNAILTLVDVYPFPKSINPKVNVVARLEFELTSIQQSDNLAVTLHRPF